MAGRLAPQRGMTCSSNAPSDRWPPRMLNRAGTQARGGWVGDGQSVHARAPDTAVRGAKLQDTAAEGHPGIYQAGSLAGL